jgi:peptidyl-prolyl cis-trans isomerase C
VTASPLALASLLAVAAAGPAADAVVARVGDEAIVASEVVARSQESGLPPLAALESVIQERLLVEAARDAGVQDQPEVVAALADERRRIAEQLLVDRYIVPAIPVSREDLRRELHASADRARLSIVVRERQDEAVATLERLRGGASLIEEARTSPDPIVRDRLGVLGWVARRELAPQLGDAVFSAPLLVPSGPVAVRKGWAVILVHERVIGDERLVDKQAPQLDAAVRAARREEAARRFVASLRQREKARLDPAGLARFRAGGAPPVTAVARAGKVTVTAGELAAAIAASGADPATSDPHRTTAAVDALAWRMLDGKLVEAEVRRRGIDRDPEVDRALAPVERRLLAEQYLRTVALAAPPVRERDVEERYRAHPEDYTLAPRRPCVHVVSPDEATIDRARARLEKGEPVEQVARELGVRGHAGKVDLTEDELAAMDRPDAQPAVAAAIRGTAAGRWTAPVHTRAGWMVYRCGLPVMAERRPLSEVRGAIAEQLRQERIQGAVAGRVAELRRTTPVHIDEGALATLLAPPAR